MERFIFSIGEGKIVEKLIRELNGEGTVKGCFKYLDRPIAVGGKKLTVFVPQVDHELRELLKTLESLTVIEIYTTDCDGLKNCFQIEGFYPLETLKGFLRNSEEHHLVQKIEEFSSKEIENENLQPLAEKLGYYIPLIVSKRESVSFAWKYYLSSKGIPAESFVYPSDWKGLLEILSNIGFRDKVFPLLLGNFESKFLSEIKKRGFVPYRVIPQYKQKILSELELIYIAKKVSEAVVRP